MFLTFVNPPKLLFGVHSSSGRHSIQSKLFWDSIHRKNFQEQVKSKLLVKRLSKNIQIGLWEWLKIRFKNIIFLLKFIFGCSHFRGWVLNKMLRPLPATTFLSCIISWKLIYNFLLCHFIQICLEWDLFLKVDSSFSSWSVLRKMKKE